MIGKIGQGGGAEGIEAKNLSKMSWKLEVVSMVLFCSALIVVIMHIRR